MAKIITVCNQKGGTGKTTTTVNLSHSLTLCDKRVMIIDMDPQGNASSGVGVNKSIIDRSVYDVLLDRCSAEEALIKDIHPKLDIIPCNINLTGAEIELVGVLSRESRLKKALAPIQDQYDFIFIDCPPSLGLLTLNSLVASHSIVIPIQCEFYALEGVSQLINTINLIREGLNPDLHVEGVLLTMADFRTNLTTEVIREIKEYFKDRVYDVIIPRNVKLSEAPSYGKPIYLYDASSIGSKRYLDFAKEFLGESSDSHNRLEGIEIDGGREVIAAEEVPDSADSADSAEIAGKSIDISRSEDGGGKESFPSYRSQAVENKDDVISAPEDAEGVNRIGPGFEEVADQREVEKSISSEAVSNEPLRDSDTDIAQ